MTTDTLIIGGGLSGLYAARLLAARKQSFLLLEARPGFGGRIRSVGRAGYAFDLGPSWFWPDLNPRLARLVGSELELPYYPQHTEGDALLEDPDGTVRRQLHSEVDPRRACRLTEGTQSLIAALVRDLPVDQLLLDHRVSALEHRSDQVFVTVHTTTGRRTLTATNVILALPPRLLAETVAFTPAVPAVLLEFFRNTPTWMAGDAKFIAFYEKSFWRDDSLSGSTFSAAGPLSESHDASVPGGPAALLGFLIPDANERAALGESLVTQCLDQLARYLGPAAASPCDTILQDWSREPFTATSRDHPLFEHPTYGEWPLVKRQLCDCGTGLPVIPGETPVSHSLWDHRLHFAGTEAATEQGGYMEGALEAAERAVRDLLG